MRSDSCSRANSRLKAQNVSASRTRRILWGASFCDEISKVPSENSKQRESRQIVAHPLQWTFLCGTLGSENAVDAGISRRRAQFSLLRRLGCGASGIRTLSRLCKGFASNQTSSVRRDFLLNMKRTSDRAGMDFEAFASPFARVRF